MMPSKKRKMAPSDDDDEEGDRKRNKNGIGEQGFSDEGVQMKDRQEALLQVATPSPHSTELPSRPNSVTPQPHASKTTVPTVDEDEWAAFEADIAVESLPIAAEATISAPALSAAELERQTAEETYAERKTRLEAELEGEKEDAARKLEDEFDEMKDFEERVRRLKEKRDALRANAVKTAAHESIKLENGADVDKNGTHNDEEEDEESSDEEDDWDGFRLKI